MLNYEYLLFREMLGNKADAVLCECLPNCYMKINQSPYVFIEF